MQPRSPRSPPALDLPRLGYAASAALPLGSVPLAPARAGEERDAGGARECACVLFVTSVRAVRAVWSTCRAAQKAL